MMRALLYFASTLEAEGRDDESEILPIFGLLRVNLVVLRQAFEQAGVEFIYENGGGPGV
jgi:hypothetical protein